MALAQPLTQPPALTGAHNHHRTAEDRAAIRHDYLEGVHTRHGSDGRVYILCRVCDLPANAGRHRPESAWVQAAATRAARRAQAHPERPHDGQGQGVGGGGDMTDRIPDRHPYAAGLASTTDKRGHRLVLCATCGGPANSPKHRGQAALVADTNVVIAAITAGEATPPKVAPATRRPRTLAPTAPMEYVQVALAIDAVLALPADAVPWRLRLRLADVRGLLEVPAMPSLAAEYTPVPDAPPQAVLDARPDLTYHAPVHQDVRARGIIRGIRSDRIKRLATRAAEQGWDVSLTGSGHLRLAKGDQVVIGSTTAETGSGHGWGNLRSQARRAGIDVTGL